MRKRASKGQLLASIILGAALGMAVWHVGHSHLAKTGIWDSLKGSMENARLKKELQSRPLIIAAQPEHGFPPEAFVLLASMARHTHHTSLEGLSIGFAIGDGTLVLTAGHCARTIIHPRSKGLVAERFIISPYYGDLFDFEVVAIDEKADIAVLRSAWKTHPSLRLATEQDLKEAEQVFVCGRRMEDTDLLTEERQLDVSADRYPLVRMERVKVLKGYTGDRQDNEIVLGPSRYVLPGWSGSAFLRPENATVVGILTQGRMYRKTQRPTPGPSEFGCSVRSIRALLEQHHLREIAEANQPSLAGVPDANEAFGLVLNWFRSLRTNDPNAAWQHIQRFTAIRPASVIGYRLAGETGYGLSETRRQACQRAIDLAPSDARSYACYGWYLNDCDLPGQALVEIQRALSLDPNNSTALLGLLSLSVRVDAPTRMDAATRLTRIDPESPLCWYYYSEQLYSSRQYQESLAAAEKAVGLDPNGPFRSPLGRALVTLGRLDEAEIQFKKMTELCGCKRCWNEYLESLIDQRADPNALKLAQHEVQRLGHAKASKISPADLRAFRIKVKIAEVNALARSAMQDAEQLTRDWIQRDPNEGYSWSTLADLLRTQHRFDEAAQAARKAVDLGFGGTADFRPRLADCLAKAGQLDAAEWTYQQMLDQHPERAYYWFWYAKYLADHHPDRVEQARQALDKASDPNAESPVEPNDLAALRRRIGLAD